MPPETITLKLINSAIELPPKRVAQFWLKAERGPTCWRWQKGKDRDGYGIFTISTWPCAAHRVAWVLERGPIPVGMFVCHTCDVRDCINPDHLFLGTAEDNSRDMVAKGRSLKGDLSVPRRYPETRARGERHGFRLHPERRPRGERLGTAKLTDSLVREIRSRYEAGGITQKQLSVAYGVCSRTINLVVRRISWAHIL